MIRARSWANLFRTSVMLLGDVLLATLAVIAVVAVRRNLDLPLTRALLPPEKFPLDLRHLVMWSASLAIAMALCGFYDVTASPRHRPTLLLALPLQVALVAVAGTFFEVVWPRSLFVGVPLIEGLALIWWRVLLRHLWPRRTPRAILVGHADDLVEFVTEIAEDRHAPLEIEGLVTDKFHCDHTLFLGTLEDDDACLAITNAGEVIDIGGDDGSRRLQLLKLRGARGFLLVPHVRDGIMASARFGIFGDRLLAEVRMRGAVGAGAVLKRAIDMLLAAALIVITAPLQIMAAIAVAIQGRGGVFLHQPRLGMDGRMFTMWKFRTMFRDTSPGGGPVVDDDLRVTSVGRWLRRYRIDELPQLFNVLGGSMSMVGPRPEIPELAAAISERVPYFDLRLCMKPGIAGLAQVSAEYDQSPETKLTYDLQYLCSWSPLLDLRILIQTMTIVLAGRGV